MSHAVWPALNATLNATSAMLLIAGYLCIRSKRITAHACCMIAAAAVSLVFLASYLAYHAQVGSVRFAGTGPVRPVYFAILSSHTILALVIVPLAARTLWLAWRERFASHRSVAKWTLPLWLYVSITGVVVYLMLYHAPSAWACPGCKDALFDPGQLPQKLGSARGYALSILLMLSMPALLVGGSAALIVRAHRRKRRDAAPQSVDSSPLSG